jgi:ribosome maturation factor RimP
MMARVEAFERERELTEAITPTVEGSVPGVEVLAVELLSPTRFCVYVDHPTGVDFELCERVTRVLDPYRSEWTIDVSSPGPERPLRRPQHFEAAVGRAVELRTASAVEGKTRFRGEIIAADTSAVSVATEDTTYEIPVEMIVRGNLIDEGR